MRTITIDKDEIRKAMDGDGDEYTNEELCGYRIEEDDECRRMVTRPAPEGEPRHYNSRTNTGGRRFVCWSS
jgi:hypothetical protein